MWNVYMCKDESRDDRQNFDLLVYLYNCHLIKHAKIYAAEGPFLPVWTEAHHEHFARSDTSNFTATKPLPQHFCCHNTDAATAPPRRYFPKTNACISRRKSELCCNLPSHCDGLRPVLRAVSVAAFSGPGGGGAVDAPPMRNCGPVARL